MNRPDRAARRLLGKSDPLDAQAAARAVLSGRARARAKSGDGPVHSARIYKLAKDSAVKARTQAINQFKAVLVIADPALRERLSSLGNAELFRTCARLGPPDGGEDEDADVRSSDASSDIQPERSSTWSDRFPTPARHVVDSPCGACACDSRTPDLRLHLLGNTCYVQHRL
ncbi:hypothetical protein SUDANB9_05998 [Streptomyces sp. enrichment culture]